LHNLVDGLDVYQALITDQTALTNVKQTDKLLIADSSLTAGDAPRSVVVSELFQDGLSTGTYTNVNAQSLLYTNATGNYTISTGATITTGTIPNLTSSTANITLGTIPTLTTGTTTSTAENVTRGTIQTLTASTATITTGTVSTLNSTTGTIGNLSTTLAGDFTISQGTGTLATSGVTLGTYGGATSIPTLVIDAKGRVTTASTSILSTTFATGSSSAPSITTTSNTNTGIFFPATNTIGFATQGTEVSRLGSTGDFSFNSGYGSSAVAYGCRAWVNFNGTGTIAILGSGNVSSITDNGVGDYTAVFTIAMPDVKYSAMGVTGVESGSCFITPQSATNSTAGWRFVTNDRNISFNQRDQSNINVAIFR
jgi:hypothetical protein